MIKTALNKYNKPARGKLVPETNTTYGTFKTKL
jgi:hypothetical protein